MSARSGIDRLSPWNSACGDGWGLRALVPLFLAVALSAVVVDTAMAQSVPPPGVRISFTADRSELTVGDVVTLSLVVAYPAELAVVIPPVGREWGLFEVQAQTAVQTVSASDGSRTIAKQFRVTLFVPGVFETPALPVNIRSPDGSVEQVYANPVRLTVNSVLSGPDEELKDLRSPADLSTPLWEQPVVQALAVLAVLAALGTGGYLLHRRSRRQEALPEEVIDMRRPWEAAVQELDRIERLDLPGAGDLKEHYILVSGVMRAYLQATYLRDDGQVDATDMSTEEIGAAIWRSSPDHRNARLVEELLQEADLVKFANFAPPVSQAYEAAGKVRDFVATTKPMFEDAPPEDSAHAPERATP